jgi:hypothetical protein
MAIGRPRDRGKERQWRQWFSAWRASGQAVREFCDRRGLNERAFYAWRRRLVQRDAEATHFVPVQVVAESMSTTVSPLEVVSRNGRSVRVGPGFDAPTLRQLLAVLEERQPC